jgi:HEAT repeats
MFNPEDYVRCLEMFRRLARPGFDGEAATWLTRRKALAEDFMMEHFDFLTPQERMQIYCFLFGMFRQAFKRVVNFRLRKERDPECRKLLVQLQRSHRNALQQPYRTLTTAELLGKCEQDLKHEDPLMRCHAAMGVYALTRRSKRIIPVLVAILRNRAGAAREQAAKILGELPSLNQEAIQELRTIANDTGDPVRAVAEEALNTHKHPRGLLKRVASSFRRTPLAK